MKTKIEAVPTNQFWFDYFILKAKTQQTDFDSIRFVFNSTWLFYIKNQKLYFFGVFDELDFSLVFLFGSFLAKPILFSWGFLISDL